MAQSETQFQNRGFESWANFGSSNSTLEPVHWHSTKSASGPYNSFLSQQIEPSTIVRPGSSGSKSARIWPRSVVGVTANGNMTNGRMNAGSMSATGAGNYNYTQRSEEPFNTPINLVPDSLSVWVCFRSASATQNAQVRAAVHGDADFKFVSNGTVDPANQLVATAMKTFKRTSAAGGSYLWKRITVPFVYDGPCNDPRYILFTVTTNENPGEGGTSDDLLVDDILLIYNPSIEMGSIDHDVIQIGEGLDIPFTLSGTMSPDNLNASANEVIAQLSDETGDFSDPNELGRVTTNSSGTLSVTIPSGTLTGEHYRIRLVTTNYPMTSEDNGFDISIIANVAVTETKASAVKITPNPTDDVLHLVADEQITDVELFSMDGKRVLTRHTDSNEVDLSVEDLSPGTYVIRCCSNGSEYNEKVMIK